MARNSNFSVVRNQPDVALLSAEFVIGSIALELRNRDIPPRFLETKQQRTHASQISDRHTGKLAAATGALEVAAAGTLLALAASHPAVHTQPVFAPRSQPADMSAHGVEEAGGAILAAFGLGSISVGAFMLRHPRMAGRIKTVVAAEKYVAADRLRNRCGIDFSKLGDVSTDDLQRAGEHSVEWLSDSVARLSARERTSLTVETAHEVAMKTAFNTIVASQSRQQSMD